MVTYQDFHPTCRLHSDDALENFSFEHFVLFDNKETSDKPDEHSDCKMTMGYLPSLDQISSISLTGLLDDDTLQLVRNSWHVCVIIEFLLFARLDFLDFCHIPASIVLVIDLLFVAVIISYAC